MKISIQTRLPLLAILLGSAGTAHAKDYLDPPFTALEHEAAYTAVSADGLTRSYVSSAIYIPSQKGSRDPNSCQTTDKPNGALCFKLAGGGAHAQVVGKKYFWRPANKGHDTPWLPCELANGCTAYSTEFFDNGRTVTTFRVWTGPGTDVAQADFRVDLNFASVPKPPTAVRPSAEALGFSNWQANPRNQKYN